MVLDRLDHPLQPRANLVRDLAQPVVAGDGEHGAGIDRGDDGLSACFVDDDVAWEEKADVRLRFQRAMRRASASRVRTRASSYETGSVRRIP